MMPPGRGYTTAELSVNVVKAIALKVQRVRAEGKVIHCGRQLETTAEARLFGPDGTLYAADLPGGAGCPRPDRAAPLPPPAGQVADFFGEPAPQLAAFVMAASLVHRRWRAFYAFIAAAEQVG